MRGSFFRWRIIGALLALALLAGGCSSLRLTYNQGAHLLYWWLDGYVDVSDEQAPRVREAIAGWFRWHRTTQLPDYVVLLARVQAQIGEPTTPEAVCALWADMRRRGDTALDAALPAIAEFLRTLSPQQIRHVERRFAKGNRDFRDAYLQGDAAERRRAALKRMRERAETLYGSLERAQREQLAQAVAASPFDPEAWHAERRARQADILHTLHAVQSGQIAPAQTQGALHALAQRLAHSPRPAYRAYQERLTAYNCRVAAELHNVASPAQREAARLKLRGWEDDLRLLAGLAPAP
jgi:hypothetical protein